MTGNGWPDWFNKLCADARTSPTLNCDHPGPRVVCADHIGAGFLCPPCADRHLARHTTAGLCSDCSDRPATTTLLRLSEGQVAGADGGPATIPTVSPAGGFRYAQIDGLAFIATVDLCDTCTTLHAPAAVAG